MQMIFRLVTLGLVCFAISFGFATAQETETEGFGPYSPEEASKHFELHPDCKIELVACEPDVIDPVHIAFNTDGKLWVVEYTDYPNGPGEGQPGLSRIRVLSDDDGDGRYTNPVTFAEKLLFANGLMFWKDGVIVTTDGKIEFMRDTNNDGKADDRQVWFQGFATKNPQLRHNHPQLAMDCKIYVANGLRGGDIVPGKDNPWGLDPDAKPLSISGRDFRFDPLSGKYEAIAGMGQFGLAFDNYGNRFVCTNRNPCRQIVLENEQLNLTPGLRIARHYEDVAAAGEASKLYPISRTWTTSNLHANQFTAACGVMIYNDSSLGLEFNGNSFTCDPTANLVHREVQHPIGPTSRSLPERKEREFLRTKDEWFRPVNLSHGPDKALYIVDMYRAVIEHPQFMPVELKDRPDLTLGTDRGRIWRVVRKERLAVFDHEIESFNESAIDEMVAALFGISTWKERHAQRLLLQSDPKKVVDSIRSQIQKPELNGTKYILSLLATFESLTIDDLSAVMKNSNNIYFIRSFFELGQAKFHDQPEWKKLVNQSFKQRHSGIPFRAHVFEILGRIPWSNLSPVNQQIVLKQLLSKSMPGKYEYTEQYDPFWTSTFLQIAARKNSLDVCTKFIEEINKFQAKDQESSKAIDRLSLTVVRDLAQLVARQNQDGQTERLLKLVLESDRDSSLNRMSAIAGISRGIPGGRAALTALIEKLPANEQATISAAFEEAKQTLASSPMTPELSVIIFDLLSLADDDETLQQLITATGSGDANRASLALSALLKRPADQVNPALKALLPKRRGSVRRSILLAMASNSSLAPTLLDEIEAGRVPPLEIDATSEKNLYRHKDGRLVARAKKLLKKEPPADRVKVLADYQVSLTMKSDPLRGKVVFEKNCATCHKIGGVGIDVAPDISDSRTKTPIFLLTNIVDPNRAIDANYFSFNVLDTDGRVHTGIVTAETSSSITLKQPEGKIVTIARDEIEQFKNNGVSLMPVGLERTINKQQMADVISFIKNWRYLDGLVPKEVIK